MGVHDTNSTKKWEVVRNKDRLIVQGYNQHEDNVRGVYYEYVGELRFFLGIQFNQCSDGVYIHQNKYTKEILFILQSLIMILYSVYACVVVFNHIIEHLT